MKIQVLRPEEIFPKDTLFPLQTHSSNIIEIINGQENLENCDGLWTKKTSLENFTLGVKTADCAPICFFDDQKFGIIHAGWRGCVNGIIENMNYIFTETETQIQIGPIMPKFEIQKDFCYDDIYKKFGDKFFTEQGSKIIFDFKSCLSFLLPTAKIDPRETFKVPDLTSWRRDRHFENGQNKMIISLE